ncbi:MAG: multidrug effflux MFS transporter [Legionellales bacterium]|nr:multidrug effflux MFS transporter [Legionellales bacterium]
MNGCNQEEQKYKLMTIIVLLCAISSAARFVIDSTLPSLPAISQAFGVSGNQVQLTLSAYMLGFGLSQLIYGPLSDRWGRKSVLIGGCLLFLFANTAMIFTHSFTLLLLFRLLAGVGMGACGVLNRAIASDCFSGAAFSKAWSYTTTTLVAVLALAPLLGSVVQEWVGWHANYLMATLYVTLILSMIIFKLPETNVTHRLSHLSLSKVFKDYRTIFTTPSFIASSICYSLAFAGLIAYFQVSSLLLMNVFHLSAIQYGASSLVIAVCYFVGGFAVTQLVNTVGTKNLLLAGILILITSGLIMWIWGHFFTPSICSLLLPVSIFVIGARVIIPNALSHAFNNLRHLGGSTSAILGCLQMTSAALISYILAGRDYSSTSALAITFIGIGVVSLVTFYSDQLRITSNKVLIKIARTFVALTCFFVSIAI